MFFPTGFNTIKNILHTWALRLNQHILAHFYNYLFFLFVCLLLSFVCKLYALQAFLVAQTVKNLPAIQETLVWSLFGEDPVEKKMTTHSSILAWRVRWTEKPGELHTIESQRVGCNWVINTHTHTHTHTHTPVLQMTWGTGKDLILIIGKEAAGWWAWNTKIISVSCRGTTSDNISRGSSGKAETILLIQWPGKLDEFLESRYRVNRIISIITILLFRIPHFPSMS